MKQTGLISTMGFIPQALISGASYQNTFFNNKRNIFLSTDFISGGGEDLTVISNDPVTVRFKPHNEADGGWSQVWWYFMVDGLTPGEKITLQLDRDEPGSSGISPQIFFSYDQQLWGLTNTGRPAEIEGRDFFIYEHIVRSKKVWFAYDLPYTPDHIDELLLPAVKKDPDADVVELCKTKNNHSVKMFVFNDKNSLTEIKYGIWLQARSHAFESGASWVLHEMALWLMSGDPEAEALRRRASITVIPIVDVDGVIEGRTGKNQNPYDHNRGWDQEPAYWQQINSSKALLSSMADQNMPDMYIDFHGPGNSSHPYFIVPFEELLPTEKQRLNRSKFFETLKCKELDDQARLSQSMTQFYYSPRPWDKSASLINSRGWVTMNTTDHNIALTIEVNMNTPLSTRSGYRAEAIELGRAISGYFTNDYHQR